MRIVITGASRGIGFELAKKFSGLGHEVMAIARTKSKLVELEKYSLSDSNFGRIVGLECDLSSDLSPLNSIVDDSRELDVLINNAGTLLNKPFGEILSDEMEEIYKVNVFTPFRVIQKLMPAFSKKAHIINIGSIGGVNGTEKFPGLSVYSSSKGALSILTECLQAEYSEGDLTFNCLALGAVHTEMLEEAFPGYQADVSAAQMAAYICNFALNSASVMRGKTISVSRSNP